MNPPICVLRLQWRVNTETHLGKEAYCYYSPEFVCCGHSWSATLLISVIEVKLFLTFVSQRRRLRLRQQTHDLGIYLWAVAPAPACLIDYQLWVAHPEDPGKDMHKEAYAGSMRNVEVQTRVFNFFMPSSNALNYMAGFVKDGHMTVGVHISVPVTDMADVLPAQVCDSLSSALSCNIATLFDDTASSDVAITAGDTTVHAHKAILAAQSPSFKAMFQCGLRETHDREIELGDMDGPVLTALMSAIYGKLKQVPAAIALPLFLAADKYQINALQQACQKHLISHITIDTMLPYYSAADSLSDNKLRSACIEFMACPQNSVLVAKHPDMQQLMLENPNMIQRLWIQSTARQAAQ